jgi:hypothetical protein
MTIRKELLDILACPGCKASPTPTEDGEGLVCEPCKVVFPIREDIPVMIVEEAVPLEEWQKGVRKAERKEKHKA